MPLARIITNSADDSLELSMQLRARGFLVETVSPDQVSETAADLEVRMEECAPEDVLIRAAQVKESEDLWVFVAPGALDERSRPMRTIHLPAQADEEPVAEISGLWEANKRSSEIPQTKPQDLVADLVTAPPPILPSPFLRPELLPSGGIARNDAVSQDVHSLASPSLSDLPSVTAPVETPSAKVKVVVVPKPAETPQIPQVPERPVPVISLPAAAADSPRQRLVGPYKIAFRTGPAFWKTAAVSVVLVLLAAVLAGVIGLRPSLPVASGPTSPVKSAPQPPAHAQTSQGHVVVPTASPAVPKPDQNRALGTRSTPATTQSVNVPANKGNTAVSAVAPTMRKQDEKTSLGTSPAPVSPPSVRKAAHPPGWLSDREIIAKDTVVFYDRKPGTPAKTKSNPARNRNPEKN
jgi:hypothetical protein